MNPLAWMDVISNDIDRTLDYYADRFGWTSEELPLDHGKGYRIVRSGSETVAGAEQVAAERKLDPVWTLMVETDDAPSLIEAAVAAGAEETFALAPMLDLGRIAMLRDPWGATLGVWEPGTFRPSAVPSVPGRLVGAVLTTPDPAASSNFHREVFGWASRPGPHDLEAGIPAFVEQGGEPAIWTPILHAPAADPEPGEPETATRLADAGLSRSVDPMGATFYTTYATFANSTTPARSRVPGVNIGEDKDEQSNA